MKSVHKHAIVRYPAPIMFELVDDIESYPKFLPWCQSARILKREPPWLEAELMIARGGFRQSFATRNYNVPPEEIRMSLLHGPFQYLEGIWRFQALREDACKISFDLEFEMASRLGSLAFGTLFNQICDSMVAAFSSRAKQLYG